MERIQKVIASSGFCSRRKAEELIVQRKVKVNGIIVDQLGFKVDKKDDIEVDGTKITNDEKVTYIINKPKNVLSTTYDDRKRTCVVDLVEESARIYPIGRLDYNSTGLLFLTNDGQLTNFILQPKNNIPKTYEVVIDGIISKEEIQTLSNGVVIDGYFKTGKADIKVIDKNFNKKTTHLKMTIYEGHNRQIRKMFELLEYAVLKLHRIQIANIELGNLKSGQYRKLKPYEIVKLKKYFK